MTASIDLNCDMGESFGAHRIGDDAAMMPLITSANVACGFHGGDPPVIGATLALAKAAGVAVGAHPSFMDLYGFGRRRIMGERPEDLKAQLVYQIGAVKVMADSLGWPITHVKTHGALGNMAAEDPALAAVCVGALRAVDPTLALVAMPYSALMRAAEAAGVTVVCEVYADRRYADNGMLMPRGLAGAVIHDPEESLRQVLSMVLDGHVPTVGGKRLPVSADTLCIHGDTQGAVDIARRLRDKLDAAGIAVRPFRLPFHPSPEDRPCSA
ncbi:LamB/YcsF family protein [Ensifer soli]|uniref:LamB/YcsF family protein n=1 Tax=Ciceribacter sp. sgz301302 TaxID=3342379 RepID=UPI0035B93856